MATKTQIAPGLWSIDVESTPETEARAAAMVCAMEARYQELCASGFRSSRPEGDSGEI